MIDSGSSKTKERGLHIYVHAFPDPAVDLVLWPLWTCLQKAQTTPHNAESLAYRW